MKIKVQNIRQHQISPYPEMTERGVRENQALVTDAKLVLVECKPEEAVIWTSTPNGNFTQLYNFSMGLVKGLGRYAKPILISETENIEVGDWMMFNESSAITQCIKTDGITVWDKGSNWDAVGTLKILALPEHFSPEQLQMIVDGKLKDGDRVLVECQQDMKAIGCEAYKDNHPLDPVEYNCDNPNCKSECCKLDLISFIKLNPHITIYPVEEAKTFSMQDMIDYGKKLLELERSKIEESLDESLGNLLATLHRDGGHYQDKVGTVQAIKDAQALLHTEWVLKEHHTIEEKVYTREEVRQIGLNIFSFPDGIRTIKDFNEWFKQNVK